MKNIVGIYKITNTVTGDFYIGSSKNVKKRWTAHKSPSRWKENSNNSLYRDMQKYGVDKFDFQILIPAEPDCLKELEQQFIETLKPTYNNRRANGWDIERIREHQKEYGKKYREYNKEYEKKRKHIWYLKNKEKINKDNSMIGGKYDIYTNTFSLFSYFNSFTDE